MNVGDEATRSLWMERDVPRFPALDKSETADTVVVGAGIAGLSTAYELAMQGQSVVVLDRGAVGRGMTARTTAHLAPPCDDGLATIIKRRGLDMAKLFHQSQFEAVDRIEQIQDREGIACDFRRLPAYLFPGKKEDVSVLDEEFDAAGKLAIAASRTKGLPFTGKKHAQVLRYEQLATFHPLKYLEGLIAAIQRAKGRLYADTAVTEVTERERRVTVKTASGHTVTAGAAVVATNAPISDLAELHSKQAPYRTYAMAFRIPRNAIEDALYWDTLDPYHYVRLQPLNRQTSYLIVGGEDHKTGTADDADRRFSALTKWIRHLIPELGAETHRWSGQILDTLDFSGYIGRDLGCERVFVATGDSGQGMTHGVVAGMLLRDLILTGASAWEKVYEPSRKPLKGLGTFISENVTALKNFAEHVGPGEVDSVESLKPGQGAVVREGLSKVAAYRADDGTLTKHSAVCTHLGCLVHWNSLEKCWDCPCHGSQFSPDGHVLNGPAIAPLEPVGS